uniref:Protein kinase domain-containing protein n=1 Tax=Panagrolaimus davidi TaxID=227884 RepID=A0A914PRJ1_9BILA
MKNIPSGENKEELSKGCDEFYIPEGKFKINFNLVKGQGLSSTVYEATIKRALLLALPRKSFDHNSISEDYVVAAKLLNHLQQDQISQSDFYGEINAARKLGKHDKICTLLGWSAHLEAPCLLFELMEMDLYNYLLRLREPLSQSGSENGSTITLSVTESEHYSVPDFDEKQQKIFLQILWQASQGLDYIASKNIVHR